MSGVFGIALNKGCLEELKSGASLLQPRGDEWGGFSILKDQEIKTEVEKGKIKPIFERKESEDPEIKKGQTAIAHLSQRDPQPVAIKETKIGPISLAFNGKIIDREELQEKSPYLVGSDAEVLARLVAEGEDPLNGLKKIYQNIKGPFSLVLLTQEGLFAARDILGIRPLVIGRIRGEEVVGCAVASESIVLEHIGMDIIRDVKPGEIVEIKAGGFKTLEQVSSDGLQICSFEYGYWARPSSIIEDIPVGLARYNMGVRLASSCPKADLVAGLPMSGNTAAEGCQSALKIPFRSIFDFNIEAGGRSFIPLLPQKRAERAKHKLLIMKWAVVGMIVIVVDDSIVEGNQTMARIFLAKKAGAREVHLRIASPQMKYLCPFDITPRGELLAAVHSEKEMGKILGVKSLGFNKVEDYTEAIISSQGKERKERNPLRIKNLCLGCFTGDFPRY